MQEGGKPRIDGRIPKKCAPVLIIFFVAPTISFLMVFALEVKNLFCRSKKAAGH
jgi:hypothetical protein